MPDKRDETENEEPLDPAMERVRRKMVRLLTIAIGTMLIGLMAVLGAIVYKAGDSGVPEGTATAILDLPDGFAVSDTDYSENRILFYGTASDGTTKVLIFDAGSGALVADHEVK